MASIIQIERLHTHDAEFTHGYEYGYVKAKLESKVNFSMEILRSQISLLLEMMPGSGASVTMGAPVTRQYGVIWRRIDVTF